MCSSRSFQTFLISLRFIKTVAMYLVMSQRVVGWISLFQTFFKISSLWRLKLYQVIWLSIRIFNKASEFRHYQTFWFSKNKVVKETLCIHCELKSLLTFYKGLKKVRCCFHRTRLLKSTTLTLIPSVAEGWEEYKNDMQFEIMV